MDAIKNTKAIDIHSHCTPFAQYCPPYKSGAKLLGAEELLEIQDRLGVGQSVLLPLSAPEGLTTIRPSEEAKFLVDQYPDRFFWFCNVDPRAHQNAPGSDLVYLLEHYKKLGAKGVGEVSANLYVDDPKMEHFFDACEACDMPILFHLASSPNAGYGIYDDMGLPRIEQVLKNHPKLKLIGHSTDFWSEISGDLTLDQRSIYPKGKVTEGGTIPRLLRQYPNLYCDLSAGSGSNAMMRDPEHAARFMEEFSDRIMYGCDITHAGCNFAFEFREFLDNMLDDGKLSPENYKKILRENAIRILKLDV